MDFRGTEKPRTINLAGGYANSMSLRELSTWCAEKIGPASPAHNPNLISSDQSSRPFDIPWAILDPSLAQEAWAWKPTTALPQILEEIHSHAETNPNWLDLVTR